MGGTLAFEDGNGVLRQAGTAYPYPVSNAPAAAAGGGNGGSVQGHADATDTTSTQLIAAVSGKQIYLQGWAFTNSGATTVTVTFQDGASGSQIGPKIVVPAGGGNNMAATGPAWAAPTTAGNALYFAADGSTSTLHGGAVGFAQ